MKSLFALLLVLSMVQSRQALADSFNCTRTLTTEYAFPISGRTTAAADISRTCHAVNSNRNSIACIIDVAKRAAEFGQETPLRVAASLCATTQDTRLHTCLRKIPDSEFNFTSLREERLSSCQAFVQWETTVGVENLSKEQGYSLEDLIQAGFDGPSIEGLLGSGAIFAHFCENQRTPGLKTFYQDLHIDYPQAQSCADLFKSLTSQHSLILGANGDVDDDLSTGLPLMSLSSTTVATFYSRSFSNLEPMLSLKKISVLSLSDTRISDLSLLAGLQTLQGLAVDHTWVTDLTPINHLHLDSLNFGGTAVRSLDALTPLSDLIYLQFDSTPVSDLAPIASLSKIQEISATSTGIHDLRPLAGLTKLDHLCLDRTPVSDLTPISNLKSMSNLSMGGTALTSLAPLAGLSSLETVNLKDTKITDLTPLTASLRSIAILDLENTPISSLSSLDGASKLTELYVSGSKISQQEAARFKAAHPKVTIDFDSHPEDFYFCGI